MISEVLVQFPVFLMPLFLTNCGSPLVRSAEVRLPCSLGTHCTQRDQLADILLQARRTFGCGR